MFYNQIISIVLILFPVMCYLIYIGEYTKCNEKNKNLYLSLSLYSSIYLYIKYISSINEYNYSILMNIPLLIAIIKKRKTLTIGLSVFLVIITATYLNQNFIYLVSEYSIYYLLCSYEKEKNTTIKIVSLFVLIKIFIPILYIGHIIIADKLIFILIACLILKLFSLAEEMMELSTDLKRLKKEKIINDSIFKITHEIKNPIAVCKGYLDMFDSSDEEKSVKYVSILKEEIDRTLELLKDFLNYSKIDIKKEEIDIAYLLDETFQNYSSYIESSGIKIKYNNIDDEVYVEGDYKRLKQVLINLLKNSMEAIKEKKEYKGIINLNGKLEKNDYVITLKDNGTGIKESVFKNMYQPFYTTKQDGTGLGVCFSKEVIDAHNGQIDYYTSFGNWTEVIIKLPLIKSGN